MRSRASDPFQVLGLTPMPGMSDDDVRAAWRRVAAATHPDRADGGDPETFAAAAAAYTMLRTRAGRAETLADLATAGPSGWHAGGGGRLVARTHHGLLVRTAVRLAVVAAAGTVAVVSVGWQPATFAVIAAALTWAILSQHGRA